MTAPVYAAEHGTRPTTAPEKAIAPEVLENLIDEYGHIINELEDSGRVPGLSTAIVYRKQVLLEKSIGVTDISTGKPVKATTVFRVASLSKAFASALAGLLVHDGELKWSTKISNVLTYFRMSRDRATRDMTVSDILSQRTGLPQHSLDNLLEADIPYRKLVRRLDSVHMICQVGDCYSYQNIAFSIFGDMVYPLTGDFYGHQVAKRLFQPLHMTYASYGRGGLEDSASWARPHVRRHGDFEPVATEPNYYWVAPAAGVNASIRDMENWLSAQMGQYPRILPPTVLQKLHAPLVATPGQKYYSRWRPVRLNHAWYALGWRVYDYAGHTVLYHAGAVEGYRAIIGFLPEYDIGMVALWNCSCSGPGNLMPAFLDRVLQLPSRDWMQLD